MGWLDLGNISSEGDSLAKIQSFSHSASILLKKTFFSLHKPFFIIFAPINRNKTENEYSALSAPTKNGMLE
ncbi:MAG: hypothetical protein IKH61_06260 [Bacteroidales bacterium]|nr:hypothetical protein [Bacteroidales bacterium]